MKISACFVLLLAILAMTGCDSTTPSAGLSGTPPIRLGGNWAYTFNVSDGVMSTCQANATLQVNQSLMGTGDQFTGLLFQGVQVCLFGGERTEDPLFGGVSAGEISGESVRFIGLGCLHMGVASGNPPNHMEGVSSCSFSIPPETPPRTLTGTWEASR